MISLICYVLFGLGGFLMFLGLAYLIDWMVSRYEP